MLRREFLATACALCGAVAGCLGGTDPDPAAGVAHVELENHRRGEGYEFSVRIEREGDLAFERTTRLGPAGSGTDAVAFENPVDGRDDYTVRVEADGHSATADVPDLVADGDECLGLQFYLGDETLQVEHQSYDRCE